MQPIQLEANNTSGYFSWYPTSIFLRAGIEKKAANVTFPIHTKSVKKT